MFTDNKEISGLKEDIDLEYLKICKFHKCYKCKTIYPYIVGEPDNSYVDYEDDAHYDCPECGRKWYRPTGLNAARYFFLNMLD